MAAFWPDRSGSRQVACAANALVPLRVTNDSNGTDGVNWRFLLVDGELLRADNICQPCSRRALRIGRSQPLTTVIAALAAMPQLIADLHRRGRPMKSFQSPS